MSKLKRSVFGPYLPENENVREMSQQQLGNHLTSRRADGGKNCNIQH